MRLRGTCARVRGEGVKVRDHGAPERGQGIGRDHGELRIAEEAENGGQERDIGPRGAGAEGGASNVSTRILEQLTEDAREAGVRHP